MQALKGISAVIFNIANTDDDDSITDSLLYSLLDRLHRPEYYFEGQWLYKTVSHEKERKWHHIVLTILTAPLIIALRVLNLACNTSARSSALTIINYHRKGYSLPNLSDLSINTPGEQAFLMSRSWEIIQDTITSPQSWESSSTGALLVQYAQLISEYARNVLKQQEDENKTYPHTFRSEMYDVIFMPFITYCNALQRHDVNSWTESERWISTDASRRYNQHRTFDPTVYQAMKSSYDEVVALHDWDHGFKKISYLSTEGDGSSVSTSIDLRQLNFH